MYALQNDELEVQVLDPAADQERFGTRYCTGGYIFQVTDRRHGPLMSGPTYPDSFNTFDGQGIPDAFNLGPLRPGRGGGDEGLIIGVGLCDLKANQVVEFCDWQVEASADRIRMRTEQAFGPFRLALERGVELQGRSVRTTARLHNAADGRPFAMRWFPHPFYPQPAGDELCRFNIAVTFADNAGFETAPSGFIRRKDWPWEEGHYLALDHEARANLTVLQRHPVLGLVGATCSYVPTFFPIWGNPQTFSWEPFLERGFAPGQQARWGIDYDF